MKKFALLGAVAALATAGGVFAGWSFSDSTIGYTNNTNEIGITVNTQKDDLANLGTLTVSENVAITIEQNPEGSSVNHNKIKATITGDIDVSYESLNDLEDETITVSYAWTNGSGKIIDRDGDDDVTYSIAAIASHDMAPVSGSYAPVTKTVTMTFEGEIRTDAELTELNTYFTNNKITLTVTAVKK